MGEMIGSGISFPGFMYLFSLMVSPPYNYLKCAFYYFMSEVHIEYVQFSVSAYYVPLLVYDYMRIVPFFMLLIALLLKPTQ